MAEIPERSVSGEEKAESDKAFQGMIRVHEQVVVSVWMRRRIRLRSRPLYLSFSRPSLSRSEFSRCSKFLPVKPVKMLPFKKREMAADDSTFQSSAKAEA